MVYGFCGVWAVFLQFPTLWGSDRPPTLALVSWPAGSLRAFAAAALGAVASGLAWGVLFVCLIVRAGRRLAAAPYARTRRHQLAFRFFALRSRWWRCSWCSRSGLGSLICGAITDPTSWLS